MTLSRLLTLVLGIWQLFLARTRGIPYSKIRMRWHHILDSASARILLRVDASGRWQRVLYHGLHNLDLELLRERPRLREWLVLGLSMLGIALCITSRVIGWRALGRK